MLIRVLDEANPLINDLFRVEREREDMYLSPIYMFIFLLQFVYVIFFTEKCCDAKFLGDIQFDRVSNLLSNN